MLEGSRLVGEVLIRGDLAGLAADLGGVGAVDLHHGEGSLFSVFGGAIEGVKHAMTVGVLVKEGLGEVAGEHQGVAPLVINASRAVALNAGEAVEGDTLGAAGCTGEGKRQRILVASAMNVDGVGPEHLVGAIAILGLIADGELVGVGLSHVFHRHHAHGDVGLGYGKTFGGTQRGERAVTLAVGEEGLVDGNIQALALDAGERLGAHDVALVGLIGDGAGDRIGRSLLIGGYKGVEILIKRIVDLLLADALEPVGVTAAISFFIDGVAYAKIL